MAETFFRDTTRDDGTEIQVEIEVSSWGSSPQTFGPPESCHPGDPMECEIIDAWLMSDADKADAPRITLTDAERERIEQAFCEDPPEPDYHDEF